MKGVHLTHRVILHSRKGKRGKIFPVHTMKAQRGSINIGPLILNLGNSGDQIQISWPGHYNPGK